nr:uncharacterized protein LOC111983100 [Quercus suber]
MVVSKVEPLEMVKREKGGIRMDGTIKPTTTEVDNNDMTCNRITVSLLTAQPKILHSTLCLCVRKKRESLEIQKSLLFGFIQNMYDEGYVNDQFWEIQQMKKTTQPDYAVRAVTSYCMSAQNLFTQLTDHINQENVDFHQVNVSARELFEQSNR